MSGKRDKDKKEEQQEAAEIQQQADEKRAKSEGSDAQVVFKVGGKYVDADGNPVKGK
jgi:hypothetical protein